MVAEYLPKLLQPGRDLCAEHGQRRICSKIEMLDTTRRYQTGILERAGWRFLLLVLNTFGYGGRESY